VLTGLRLGAADVREYGAEIVVVATGAYWATDGFHPATLESIPGADAALPHVLTPEQLMAEGKQPPGRRVLVYDCEGDFTAVGVAEKLALEGCEVELATALRDIAPDELHPQDGGMVRRRLHELGVQMQRGIMLDAVDLGSAHCRDEFGNPRLLEVDAVVLVTQRLSNEALYLELSGNRDALAAEGVEALYRVGDCAAPGRIADAVFDGHRLAREIDSDDPSVPLPFRRERTGVQDPAAAS
jgi:dimethylamine/trimethylamine dehydrogenase